MKVPPSSNSSPIQLVPILGQIVNAYSRPV